MRRTEPQATSLVAIPYIEVPGKLLPGTEEGAGGRRCSVIIAQAAVGWAARQKSLDPAVLPCVSSS